MKTSTIAVFVLFSLCLLFSFSGTYEAHADVGTVYIRNDGSIDPPIAELSSSDNVIYSLTANLSSCIVIEKDNIVFDGAGYTLSGEGSNVGIELEGRNNVTITNVEIRDFYEGILIYNFSSNNNVFSVRMINNYFGGVRIDSSTNNNVTGNMIANGKEGITLSGNAEHNSVSRNTVEGFELYGVNLISTSNNLADSNNVSNSGNVGIKLWMSSYNNTIAGNKVAYSKVGIEVSYSSNYNTIIQNSLSMNSRSGISIGFRIPESGPEQGGAANNSFIENNVTDNNVGIYLIYSKNNTIFHNNVQWNNASFTVYGSYVNSWDDGSKGNYWSDYNGTDLYSGPYQNETGSDGIGDVPYTIDGNNHDNCPLMEPYSWSPHDDIELTSITVSKTVVGQGYNLNINVTAEYRGDYIETFNVTIYANTTVIGTQIANRMISGTSAVLAFTCNTAGFAYGNYTVSAYAESVPEEANKANNNFTCTVPVHVGVPGDCTGPTQGEYDGKCGMRDISYMIARFNGKPGNPKWDPNADVNDDSVINMRDIQIAIVHFGQLE